ncbi:MAG: beta-ketoacyl-[acyl-carrier-protein] synthase family protein [Paludibacteraceae bacterium]|nr:beta-ketoacyl-[acyl-carrier-protein] synthase family protein [Paludibacteraceae bacterium]
MAKRVVITGVGIVSAIGVGKEAHLRALMKGESGVGKISYLQTKHTDIPVGEVKMSDEEMKLLLGIASESVITRTPLMGKIALKEAMQDSGITDASRVAFINGTTVGGMEKSEKYYMDFFEGKNTDYIAAHDCGAGTEMIAETFGKFDFVTTLSTACSSAVNSIIMGGDLIRSGRVEAAIVGGAESLSKFHLNGFNTLMILDRKVCNPFDAQRNGLNLGEGAAYIVLESEESAKARNANILCELKGYGNACDAFHQTASSPTGEGAYLAMKKALEDAGLNPEQIDYVNAHGTGTGNNDLCESVSIQRLFGEKIPHFSSTKSLTGHATSAAGGIEAVISILALLNDFVPGCCQFQSPIEETGLMPVKDCLKNVDLQNVMNNSFGFGGNDSSCIFSKIR